MILDSDGEAVDYRFVDVNPSFERLTGLKREDVLGRTAKEVLPGLEDSWITTYGRVAATAEVHRFTQFSATLKRHYQVFAFRPMEGHFATLFFDVTEKKAYEDELKGHRESLERLVEERSTELKIRTEQLLHAQKLEALGRLAGGIAHDFNNLMQVVIGYAARALKKSGPETLVGKDVEQAMKAGQKAARLTRQLLAFSRKQAMHAERVDANDLVREAEPLLERLLGEDIRLNVELAPVPMPVLADPSQLEQVIINMAVNARDAMPSGGTLTIRTLVTSPGPTCDVGLCRLDVSDTGTGIEPEVIPKLFEPFFTTKAKDKGTGLGLAMAYGIVKQSGGDILVESAVGRGTTFKVLLPLETGDPPEAGAGDRQQDEQAHGSGTILIVEDEPSILELLAQELTDIGYNVLSAGSFRDAVSISGSHQGRIDMLLADLVLPDTNGALVYEALQQDRPELRVLFMSGHDEEQVMRKGVFDLRRLLSKPFNAVQLAEKVQETLNRG